MKGNKRLYDRIVGFTSSEFFGMVSDFNADIPQEKEFLWSIKEPRDDFERSYAQYCCQASLRNKWSLILLNIGCAFILIPYILKCRFKKVQLVEKKDAVIALAEKDQPKIPASLRENLGDIRVTIQHEKACLNAFDIKFIWKLYKRYPFSFYFILHIIYKLGLYRGFIEMYNPQTMVVSEEFSCVSSTLTYYCEQLGIEHINIMHGEKDYYIRDAFFRFHKCYVWDDWYIELFKSLRADKSEYVVEIPSCFKLDNARREFNGTLVDYKYYLWGNEKIDEIAKGLHQLKSDGYSIKVRPHPSFTDPDKLKGYFSKDEIEDCSVSTEVSLVGTKNAISLYSTVLLQAYLSGINVIIDNLNFPDEYTKLRELKYILIGKDHERFSEILKKDNN